jgi:hypothetical protein
MQHSGASERVPGAQVPGLPEQFPARWYRAAKLMGVDLTVSPRARVVADPTGASSYRFGVFYNEARVKRTAALAETVGCPLCNQVASAVREPLLDLTPEFPAASYLTTPNLFPPTALSSLCVQRGTGIGERPMYRTNDARSLSTLAEELPRLYDLSGVLGMSLMHNSPGGGASIPRHEHWHLWNCAELYSRVGELYGSERCELQSTGVAGVSKLVDYPFAHLVFERSQFDRLIHLLSRLDAAVPALADGSVAHILASGRAGVTVVPFRRDVGRGFIGAEIGVGHIQTRLPEEFSSLSFAQCLSSRAAVVYLAHELSLERLL